MKNFVTGLGIGLGIGALLAPRSGEETRELLRSRGQELWNSAREQVGAIAEEAHAGSILEALNTVSRDKLMSIYGVGPLTADKIISNRPYDSEETFLAQRIVPETTFESLHAALARMTA
ncbi:MAG TPA: YtxH domain-containing protein [Terriglobales bacterium]|nr:YtxH domain-containing protein [Terriglobales bacterium]